MASSQQKMIRVYIVHEMALMNNLISAVIDSESDLEVIGSSTSVSEAYRQIQEVKVDVILASSQLPDPGTIALLQKIRDFNQVVHLIVIGVTETKHQVLHFLEAGAAGYVTKDSTMEDMFSAIRLADQHKADLPPKITAAVMDRLYEYARIYAGLEKDVLDQADLTDREIEVLQLLGKDLTNNEISKQLVIEEGTVKNHVHSILTKLKVNSREQAANYLVLLQGKDIPSDPAE